MNQQFILALDQGTTSSRSIIFNRQGEAVSIAQQEFEQIYPEPGWVEHDPMIIWKSQLQTALEAVNRTAELSASIAAIGITNQRETTLVWERSTGRPIYNAIVWQDRRTADYCNLLKSEGYADLIQEKTGLVLDAYFAATKIKWILDHVPNARKQAEQGQLCFGTVDTWLVWQLTKGKIFITDVSNASRSLLFNIHNLQWDDELLKLFEIPQNMLPEIRENSEIYGTTDPSFFSYPIAIAGLAGDQHAALFGQLCIQKGMAKNTYGTGCFMLMNTGDQPVMSQNNLLTTVAWCISGKVNYALEGSIFVGGAAVQWLRDGLNLVDDSAEIESLASEVPDNGGVYFVPALTGFGAPHWDPFARGAILGITRGTTKAHIALATLEGIAYQVYDIVKVMEHDAQMQCTELRVDGGASSNNLLLQFQANICNLTVIRPKVQETTALGAAYLAGLAVGFWSNTDELQAQWKIDKSFHSAMEPGTRTKLVDSWHRAVSRSLNWVQ